MAIVDLKIHNHTHQIACDDGQEEHLHKIAGNLDVRMKKMHDLTKGAPESKVLLMVALTLEDELQEVKLRSSQKKSPKADANVTKTLDAITDYVENLANKLEKL